MKDTFNTIKSNLCLRIKESGLTVLLCTGAFIFGHIILRLVMKFDDSPDLTSFELGTLMAAMMSLFTAFTTSANSYSSHINYAISMCKRRCDVITAHIVVALVKSLISTSLIYIFHNIESYVCKTTYSDIPLDFDFDRIFTSDVFVVILLLLVAAETFMGSMLTRFGQKTYWIIWVAGMLCFTSIPSFVEQTIEGTANAFTAAIGQFFIDIFSNLTMSGLLMGISSICILLIILPYILLRKHSVAM